MFMEMKIMANEKKNDALRTRRRLSEIAMLRLRRNRLAMP